MMNKTKTTTRTKSPGFCQSPAQRGENIVAGYLKLHPETVSFRYTLAKLVLSGRDARDVARAVEEGLIRKAIRGFELPTPGDPGARSRHAGPDPQPQLQRGVKPMTTARDIINAIYTLTDAEDLKKINGALRAQFSTLQRRATRDFVKGDRVTFAARGATIVGTIEKVNGKTITVAPDGGGTHRWRVMPTMLARVAA